VGPSLQTKLAHVNESKMLALVVDKTAIAGHSTATWSFSWMQSFVVDKTAIDGHTALQHGRQHFETRSSIGVRCAMW
jgi:hypothetical protein